MNEHIALLKKELVDHELSLSRARRRPSVKPEEIANIERKIRLKNEILVVIHKEKDTSSVS